jgi:hypothetical protein
MEYIDKFDQLKKLITEDVEIDGKLYNLEEEFEKFFVKGNKVAGLRIRKAMQLIRKTSESVRKDVQDYKKSL